MLFKKLAISTVLITSAMASLAYADSAPSACPGAQYQLPFNSSNWQAMRKIWGSTKIMAATGGVTPGEPYTVSGNGMIKTMQLGQEITLEKFNCNIQVTPLILTVQGDQAQINQTSSTASKGVMLSGIKKPISEKYATSTKVPGAQGWRVGSGIVSQKAMGSGTYTVWFKINRDPNNTSQSLFFAPAIWLYHYEEHYKGDPLYTAARLVGGSYTENMGEIDMPEMGILNGESPIQANNIMLNTYTSYVAKGTFGNPYTYEQDVANLANNNLPNFTRLDDGQWHVLQTVWKTQLSPVPDNCGITAKSLTTVSVGTDKTPLQYYLPQTKVACISLAGQPIVNQNGKLFFHNGQSVNVYMDGAPVLTSNGIADSTTGTSYVTALKSHLFIAGWFPEWSMPSGAIITDQKTNKSVPIIGPVAFNKQQFEIGAVFYQPAADQTGDMPAAQADSYPDDGVVPLPFPPAQKP